MHHFTLTPGSCGTEPRRIHLLAGAHAPSGSRPRSTVGRTPRRARSRSSCESVRSNPPPSGALGNTATGAGTSTRPASPLDPNEVTGNANVTRRVHAGRPTSVTRPLAARRPGRVGSAGNCTSGEAHASGRSTASSRSTRSTRRTSPTRSTRCRSSSRSCSAAARRSRTPTPRRARTGAVHDRVLDTGNRPGPHVTDQRVGSEHGEPDGHDLVLAGRAAVRRPSERDRQRMPRTDRREPAQRSRALRSAPGQREPGTASRPSPATTVDIKGVLRRPFRRLEPNNWSTARAPAT